MSVPVDVEITGGTLFADHRRWLAQALPVFRQRNRTAYAVLDWLTRRVEYVPGGQHTKIAPMQQIADEVGISRRHCRRLVSWLAAGVVVRTAAGDERVRVLVRHYRPDDDHPSEPSQYEIVSAGLQRLAELGRGLVVARRQERQDNRKAAAQAPNRADHAGHVDRGAAERGPAAEATAEAVGAVASTTPDPAPAAAGGNAYDPAQVALDALGVELARAAGVRPSYLRRLYRDVPHAEPAELQAYWRRSWSVVAQALRAGADAGPEWAALAGGHGQRRGSGVSVLCSKAHWTRRVQEASAYASRLQAADAEAADELLTPGEVWVPQGQIARPGPDQIPDWDQVFAGVAERLGHADAQIWFRQGELRWVVTDAGEARPVVVVANGVEARWHAEHHLEVLGELVGAPVGFLLREGP